MMVAALMAASGTLLSTCGAPTSPRPAPAALAPTRPAATIAVRVVATTAPSPAPPVAAQRTPVIPTQVRGAVWTMTLRGLTLGMFFEPYPPNLGGTTTYRVVIADEAGQLVDDATVDMSVNAGMAGMEGEHDETFEFKLAPQGNGTYLIRSSVSGTTQSLTRLLITVTRGGQVWSFPIAKDELPPP
jgi:hypothetical protein